MIFMDLNNVAMQGKLVDVKAIWQSEEESFYKGFLEVVRDNTNGIIDKIPIVISNKLLTDFNTDYAKFIGVKGQIRSKDTIENDKLKVSLFLYVKEIISNEQFVLLNNNSNNVANIDGYICKKPILRTTPSGKQIADILIACNYGRDKTAYISSIAWGKMARAASKLKVGDYVSTQGKFQSRAYAKLVENEMGDKAYVEKTAYEFSIDTIKCR